MNPLGLARVAAEAEGLRLRQMARRYISRIIAGAVACLFLGATAAFLELAVWFWLRVQFGLGVAVASAIVAGGNLLIAVVFLVFAMRSSPGRIELDALEVRRRALAGMTRTLAASTVVVPLARTLIRTWRRERR